MRVYGRPCFEGALTQAMRAIHLFLQYGLYFPRGRQKRRVRLEEGHELIRIHLPRPCRVARLQRLNQVAPHHLTLLPARHVIAVDLVEEDGEFVLVQIPAVVQVEHAETELLQPHLVIAVEEETGEETGEEAGAETGEEAGGETGEEAGVETGEETGAETGEEAGEETGKKAGGVPTFRRSDVQGELRGRVSCSCVIRQVSDLSVKEFICQCEGESTPWYFQTLHVTRVSRQVL